MNEKRAGLTIRARLLMSYILLALMIAVVAFESSRSIYRVYKNGEDIYNSNLKAVNALNEISLDLREIDRDLMALNSGGRYGDIKALDEEIRRIMEDNDRLVKEYVPYISSDDEKKGFTECRAGLIIFKEKVDKVLDHMSAGDMEEAYNIYIEELVPTRDETFGHIDDLIKLTVRNAEKKSDENHTIFRRVIITVVLFSVLALAVAVAIAILMSRYLVKRLEDISGFAKRISEYDISNDIPDVNEDEIGQTMKALNDSQFMIRDLMENMIDGSEAISTIGTEVSDAMASSGKRLEAVSVNIERSRDQELEIEQNVMKILENRGLDDDSVRRLRNILRISESMKAGLSEARSELSGVSTYIDQVKITADYQNELARSQKESISKVKVKSDNGAKK